MRIGMDVLRKSVRSRRAAVRRAHRPEVERLDSRCLLDAGGSGFVQTALASNVPGVARHVNPDLINPWGFTETSQGQFRLSANGSGKAILFTAKGATVGPEITIPVPPGSPPGSTATPNGQLINTTSGFVISENGRSAPAQVIFSTEDGTIVGWNPMVDRTHGIIAADQSGAGAVYKLVAMASNSQGTFLYATDFHNNKIDVFDTNFHLVHLSGSFTDPTTGTDAIPSDFAPFGIKSVGSMLFVTYAKQDAAKHDDVAGVGNGFIDIFDTNGNFIRRFASRGTLNSPIGATIAPSTFGPFANALLIGNFGDSRVNAFNMTTGAFLGQLTDPKGNPLTLNGGIKSPDTRGLWGIAFGNGHGGADPNAMFFASGPNDETDGVFGRVDFVSEDNDKNDQNENDQEMADHHDMQVEQSMIVPLVMDTESGHHGSKKHHDS